MTRWEGSVPSLALLIAFEAAHRHRNFTRAAEELHYSQATVSRRIGALERDLGTTLFERGRHEVRPNAEADALAAAVRNALNELAAASNGIRGRAGERTQLTIRADVSLTAAVVNPIIGELQRRHPDLRIRIISSFDPIEIETEDFDVGVQYGRNRDSSYVIEPVADEEVFPVCAPELAATLPSPLTADDLAALPLLHVDYGEPAWVDWARFLESIGGRPVGELSGPSLTTYVVCLDLAERGQGVALGWGHTAQPRIDAGRLVRLPGPTMALPDAILAYRPMTTAPWEPVDDLLALLRDRLRPSTAAT